MLIQVEWLMTCDPNPRVNPMTPPSFWNLGPILDFTGLTSKLCSQTHALRLLDSKDGKGWCWNWSSNTLATWCEEPTYWKRPWYWEGLKAGGERDDRGWDGWMASQTQWTWVWQTHGDSEGQGGLVCCNPWGLKESDTTGWLNKWLRD